MRLKIIPFCIILLFLSAHNIPFAQEPDIIWKKLYTKGIDSRAVSVKQTTDSGYISIGTTYTNDFLDDLWLFKTDKDGNLLWDKTFDAVGNERGQAIDITMDGGYIIAGRVSGSQNHTWIIRTDVNGEIVWTKTIGENTWWDETPYSIQATTDGGFIIAGSNMAPDTSSTDFWLLKLDQNGEINWSKTYGGNNDELGIHVQETADGGFIIVGSTRSFGAGARDLYLIKTDSNGNLIWDRTYGGVCDDYGIEVQQSTDNGYIITGGTRSFSTNPCFGEFDLWLIKTDGVGDNVWTKIFNVGSRDIGNSVKQTEDNGYVVAGYSGSPWYDGAGDVLFIKTDENGNEIWNTLISKGFKDIGSSLQVTYDGGFIIAGSANNAVNLFDDALLIKIMGIGTIILSTPLGGENWKGGTQQVITWTIENVEFINIEYSTNAGNTWEPPIVTNYDATLGSYPWTIPNTPSNNCSVRILDSSNPDVGDTSDGTFTISPMPIVLENHEIYDNLKETLEEDGLENLFQKIYNLIVKFVFPGPTPVTTDATLSLEFSDNSFITNVFGHFYSPDNSEYSQTVEFIDNGNGIYSQRLFVNLTGPLDINTFFDMLSFMVKKSPINVFPPQIGTTAPRAVLDQIEIKFQGGSNQIIESNIELPRYDRIIYEHLEYLTGSGIYGYNEIVVASPVNLFLIDAVGKRIGNQGGTEYYEIPYAIYTGDEEPEAILVFGEEEYDLFIYGTDVGSFDYTFTQNWIENDIAGNSAYYENVSVAATSVCSTKTGAYIQEYLINMDYDGDGTYESIIYPTILTDVENDNLITVIPTNYSIDQNYPNPFNPTTRIKYAVPEESFISIKIFNSLGQEIAELISDNKVAGIYEVEFDATNLPSGIYFYRLKAGAFIETKKMVLLR